MKLLQGALAAGVVALFLGACASKPDSDDAELATSAALAEPVENDHHAPHPTADAGTSDAAAPALPSAIGPNDTLAQTACGLPTAGAQHLMLASRPEDAATVVIVPSATKRFHLHKPVAGAVGYAKIQTADWHTTVSFGAPAGVSPSVASGEATLATSRNGACSDTLTDTRFIIHEWGSYLLTFGAGGPDEFYLSALAQN